MSASQAYVIEAVTVLVGDGEAALDNARVTVRNGRIERVAKATGELPPDTVLLNGRGRFLVPGFIDMHAHLLFPRCASGEETPRFDRALSERALSRQLDFGVTFVRSPATPTIEGLQLRDDLNAGRVRGPLALASAELINDRSLTEDQMRQAVRGTLPYRPDYLKAYAGLDPRQVEIMVDEAARHGIPVIGHLQRTTWAQGAALGVDHLVHSVDWAADSLPAERRAAYRAALQDRSGFRSRIDWLEAFEPDSPAHETLLSDLVEKRISVDLTLIAYDAKFSPADEPRFRANASLGSFPDLQEDWRQCGEATADWTENDFKRWRQARPKLSAWVRRMNAAGVILVTGTDLTNPWIAPGEGLHQEFELLAEAGLSPAHILRMTGVNAAQALGRNDIRRIEAGRRADLVMLAADPRRSISNTRSIVWVMQGGRLVSQGVPRP